MAFIDEYRPGSLSGVRIHVKRSVFYFGTRVAINEKPGGDGSTTGVETIGKVPHRFSLDAFVVGDNYLSDKEELIEAIDRGTAMTLVHPTMGERQVKQVGECGVTEDLIDERLVARFPLNLVVVPGGSFVQVSIATDSAILAEIPNVNSFGQLAAADKWNGGLLGGLTSLLNAASSFMNKLEGKAASKLGLVSGLTNSINQFSANLDSLLALPGALMANLDALVTSIFDLFGRAVSEETPAVIEDPNLPIKAALEARRRFVEFVEDNPPAALPKTQKRKDEAEDMASIGRRLRVASLAGVAKVITEVPLQGATQASEILEELLEEFQYALAGAGSDEEFGALKDLESAVVEHLGVLIVTLPVKRTTMTRKAMNAITLAYMITGDVTTVDELIRVNGWSDPLFIPVGTSVEVPE